jgi:hypothetical protein
MTMIRQSHHDNNQAWRGGCLLQSPWTFGVYYANLVAGLPTIHGWDEGEIVGQEPRDLCTMADPKVSACFANEDEVVVHVEGFHPDTHDSASQTFKFRTVRRL